MIKGAQFSKCRQYRYALWRTWQEGDGHVTFIGLNPSTADETEDDPTIRRCIGFAKRWGFGGINMVNLFAFRTTDPNNLKKVDDPVGDQNDRFLSMYCDPVGLNVACWGSRGAFIDRGKKVIELLGTENLSCFGLTKNVQPRHPLYLKKDSELVQMSLYQTM
ncbi:MAG: DUF1643 domain-containing protein [Planctomycetota bacterium]|jgi:hypothetical protein